MGAVIAATAISTDPEVKSSVDHAVLAAEECLAKAGVSRKEIDILISVGIYRDENIGEPAMAPLIQKRLGMNPIYDAGMSHKTFSFDLLNGSSGFLNAVHRIEKTAGSIQQIKGECLVRHAGIVDRVHAEPFLNERRHGRFAYIFITVYAHAYQDVDLLSRHPCFRKAFLGG